MNSSYTFTAAYVITSDGRDTHADMALISMLSVRITNPDLRIVAVCDHLTAAAFKTNRPEFLNVCDEVIEVQTPDVDAGFRNRWIKTQLPRFVPGPCLFLDADTLVRSSLSALPHLVNEFGAVANHSAEGIKDQIGEGDAKLLQAIGWTHDSDFYANGGVWFYKPCLAVETLFELWHNQWIKNVEAGHGFRDQTAFNRAIHHSEVSLTRLTSEFNFQGAILKIWDSTECNKAVIWHFYACCAMGDTVFDRILKLAGKVSVKNLRRKISQAIRRKSPQTRTLILRRKIIAKLKRGTWRLLSYSHSIQSSS